MKSCRRKNVYNRPNNNYKWNISWSWYNTLRYYFCTSSDLYFKKKEKFEKHSNDLVDALKTWVESVKFPKCEYVDGSLNEYPYYSNTNEIPLIKQANEHLEKSYPHILKMHDDIRNNCTKLCRRIKEIINAQDKSSFENIIITQINSSCPKLKIIHKDNVTEYSKQSSIYTDNDVFDIIFKNHSLDANDVEIKEDKLMYQNLTNIAKGEKSELETLKQVILKLASNKEIKKLIKEYHNLNDNLENKSESFKKEILDLYYSVHGGKQLGKSKDCDICQTF